MIATALVLSDREREVVALASDGLSNLEIGVRLHLTMHTVKTHLARIGVRGHLRNRAHIVATALRQGLIQ